MAIFSKEFLYDWNGGNVWLFKQINAISGDTYDKAMLLLSSIADHHNFPYYIVGLVVIVLLSFIMRKIGRHGGTQHLLAAWFGVLLVLGTGYVAEGYVIHQAKDYFAYPRPYVELSSHDVRQLEVRSSEDNYHSFPSGHVAFITMMVVGLWPVLSGGMKWLGLALIVGVCWSRIALGVHFPADTLASILFVFLMMVILRGVIYWLLLRLFRLNAH